MGSGNCFYNGTMRFFNIQDIKLRESDLMHLFGGYSLFIKKFPNDLIPTYGVYGSLIREYKFKESTGVDLMVFYENNQESAFRRTDSILAKDQQQLVFANCYHLPFDQKNYKKNIDNHLLIIHSFNNISDSYTVSDDNGTYSIAKKDLAIARKTTNDGEFKTIQFNKIDSLKQLDVNSKLKSIIPIQAAIFLNNSLNEIKEMKEIIIKINNLESIYKKLALKSIYNTISHPNGPVITRKLMATSFNHKVYIDNYMKLSSQWKALSNNLIRLASDIVDIEDIIENLDEIYKNEKSFNEEVAQTKNLILN
ncbi:BtrH N-terminal domain-containing protein [Cytobacillus kochii]|uniref:BtrH N-terminal domain-containing protein n=1 Tax=Cytobacillus kochii TaxID=859143 RepID=UPI001CD7DAC7|nr:BtrH N-terminal domain-containing protein [Cytobacillus kochii]MCA1028624.1 BtrH N-terminal domain-containing protein [Cytobacillus kochii]